MRHNLVAKSRQKVAQHKSETFLLPSFTSGLQSNRTPARITPYPTGRLVWATPSQALRARLQSCSPSGTFFGGSHAATCPRHRANHISDRILHLRDGDCLG